MVGLECCVADLRDYDSEDGIDNDEAKPVSTMYSGSEMARKLVFVDQFLRSWSEPSPWNTLSTDQSYRRKETRTTYVHTLLVAGTNRRQSN